jgi:hypothetical protein
MVYNSSGPFTLESILANRRWQDMLTMFWWAIELRR